MKKKTQQARSRKKRTELSKQQGRTIIFRGAPWIHIKSRKMGFLKGRGCRSSGEKSAGLCSSPVGRVEMKKDPTQPNSKVLCSRREKDLQNQGARGNYGSFGTYHLEETGISPARRWSLAGSFWVQWENPTQKRSPKLEGPGMHWECSWHN